MRGPGEECFGANHGGTCALGRLLDRSIRSDHHRAHRPPPSEAYDEIVGRLWWARESNADAARRRYVGWLGQGASLEVVDTTSLTVQQSKEFGKILDGATGVWIGGGTLAPRPSNRASIASQVSASISP